MAGIGGKNTKPELQVRKALHRLGFRYSLHARDLPGKPDLKLPKYNAVIFVNGCFWHGHDCHLFRLPATRTEFWKDKIEGNRKRDLNTRTALANNGWRVLDIWECAIKGKTSLETAVWVGKISEWLTGDSDRLDIKGNDIGAC